MTLDWQGHRGARGLAPENSIPGFIKALEYPVTTLELDVVVSADQQVVVSHEPYMAAEICTKPNGAPVEKGEELGLNLFGMPYDSIRQYDCGSRGNRQFPEQEKQQVAKPLLRDVIQAVESHCAKTGRSKPAYNVEIKSKPEWDNTYTPEPETFSRLVVKAIKESGVLERTTIQSFDPRVLRYLHEYAPQVRLSCLIEGEETLEERLAILDFVPDVYSPNYERLTAEQVMEAQDMGMLVIPWTVNDVEAMDALIAMGVDGIITDYPDRIAKGKGNK